MQSFTLWLSFTVLLLLITSETGVTQEIQLESTIVRCSHDEMLEDGTPKNPLQLASSFKGHPKLNLKFYSKCRKKLLITLRVTESSDDIVPNALILIDRAKNILTQKSSRFGLPIAVKFHQEVLLQKYGLKYLFRVNGKMWEEVINYENSKNYTGCSSSVDHHEPPTCGYIPGTGSKQVAGFCCSCQEHRNNIQQRGGQRCDVPHISAEQLTSAHCLRSSPYWYNVYEILPPSLYQKLNFEIFKSEEHRNGSISWERMSGNGNGVQVDSDLPMNAAGAMKVTYRPHVEGVSKSVMLFDSESQRLLFPLPYPFGSEQFPDPDPLKGPIEDQMLIVPKTLMSPHGVACDHVGTQIDAFANQQEPCRQERNSCLQNQPFDLWKQDQGPHGDPKLKFRLNSFQRNHSPLVDFAEDYKTGSIYVEHTAAAPTYVDIEIPADDIVILAPGYNAFIESVLTDTGSEGAKVVANIINKELVEAAFTVELVQCNLDLSQVDEASLDVGIMKTSKNKIGPLNAKYFYLDLHSHAFKVPIYCYIVLVNEYGESIAAREVILKPYETCLCVHTCKCACGEKTNVKCEKMSEENIIATGLISSIKTAAQIEEQQESQFTQKYKWVFHWILVFHIVLLIFAFFGWLQKQCAKSKPKKRTFPQQEHYEEINTSGSSDTSEVTLFDRNMPSDSKRLDEEVFGWKYNNLQNVNTEHSQSVPVIEMESIPSDIGVSQAVSESMNASKSQNDVGSTGASKVTFANHPQFQELTTNTSGIAKQSKPSSVQTIATFNGASNDNQISGTTQRPLHSILPSQISSTTVSSQQGTKTIQATTDQSQRSILSSKQSGNATQSNADFQTLTGSRSATEPNSTKRNQQGPKGTESWTNNTENNHSSIDDFVNYCVSASSSKTSFGTWHRKKRDQYSAYDFLPEPKQKDSLTLDY